MSAVFGTEVKARLFLPKGSSDWNVDGLMKKGEYENVMLQTFALNDQDIVDVRRCFEETTHIFAFGRNPQSSTLSVSFVMFMYDGCNTKGSWLKIDELRKKYKENRVYEKTAPIKVQIDELNLSGFLFRMSISDVNPATKACLVTLMFMLDQEV